MEFNFSTTVELRTGIRQKLYPTSIPYHLLKLFIAILKHCYRPGSYQILGSRKMQNKYMKLTQTRGNIYFINTFIIY